MSASHLLNVSYLKQRITAYGRQCMRWLIRATVGFGGIQIKQCILLNIYKYYEILKQPCW